MTDETQDTQNAEAQQTDSQPDYKAMYEEMRTHSREWEKRANANKSAAEELKKLKEAQMTDAEKTKAHISELESKVAEFESAKQRQAWREKVAKETGVPANVLHGDSEEEMRENAQTLKPLLRTVNAPLVAGADRQPASDTTDTKKEQEISYINRLFHKN